MDKIPFSVYDFFAYLSSGAVWLVTADYIFGTGLLGREKINPVLGVVLVILAYVSGQVVSHFSSFLFEHALVGRLLKRPNAILIGEDARWQPLKWTFPNYFRPLPQETRDRVMKQMESRGVECRGEALFLHAYPIVTANAVIQGRLDTFRNQYGFARNMAFALITSAIAMLVARQLGYYSVHLRWALLASLIGIALFYRYLKFFRQYSYELFLRYAELILPES